MLGGTLAAAYATLKGHNAVLWTVAAGGQSFVLGSTFWATRIVLKKSFSNSAEVTLREDLLYSTVAGAVAGGVGGSLRSRANIAPGMLVMGTVGLGGTAIVKAVYSSPQLFETRKPILARLAETSWWPLRSLSDEEYKHELSEKALALEAEIAIIDENIAALRASISSSQR